MRCWLVTTLVVFALIKSDPAFAQGFSLTSAADAAIGRDYGFIAHDQKLTDTILTVRTPRVNFANTTARTDFSLAYQPEFELFDNNRNLSTVNQTATANFTFRLSQRLRFNAGDDALATHDPTRTIPGILIFLPRENFRQNSAHAAFIYAASRKNILTFSFDNVATPHRVRNAGTVSLAHAFGRKQTVTATYSTLNAHGHFAGVAYDGDLSHDLSVHVSTGLLADEGKNYLMASQIEKRVGGVWISAGYHRFLSIFGSSIPGSVPIGNDLVLPTTISRTDIYQVFSAGILGKLTSRTEIELSAAATKNNSGTATRDINNITGRFKLAYSLTERLRIYTDNQIYNQDYNVFVGSPIDRQRFIAGLQFDISLHPNRVSNVPTQTKPTDR